jgi:hypothetical protein
MTRSAVKKLNRQLAKLSNQRLSCSDFLNQVKQLDMPQEVFEGIYTGEEGRMHEQIPGTKFWIVLTWYNKKVEVAYIS